MAISEIHYYPGGPADPIPLGSDKRRIVNSDTKDIIVDLVSDVGDSGAKSVSLSTIMRWLRLRFAPNAGQRAALATAQWFKVFKGELNENYTKLNAPPDNLPTLRKTFGAWDYAALIILPDQLCHLRYNSHLPDEKVRAKRKDTFYGYQLGAATDIIYIFVDSTANEVKLYYD